MNGTKEQTSSKHRNADVEKGDITRGASKGHDDVVEEKTQIVTVFLQRVAVMFLMSGLMTGGGLLWYYEGWEYFLIYLFPALLLFLIIVKHDWFYVAACTAKRDFTALSRYIKTLRQIRRYARRNMTVAQIFSENAKKWPNREAVVFEDRSFTFGQLEEFSNKVANIFKSQGYKKGDVIALYLDNKPEYIGFWLGLSKIGCVIPLINSNLKQKSLLHSITVAKSVACVFGDELKPELLEIFDEINNKVALYQFTDPKHVSSEHSDPRFENVNELLKNASSAAPVLDGTVGNQDGLVYIYTSGTTGLPKAAVITNSRYIFITVAIHFLAGFKDNDRFYTPLPLYHTAGGCMSTGQMLIYGSTLITRKKFSASSYFPDCKKYNATVAQYIGEMCRYVLATTRSESDKAHKVRLIYGNGLRPQIWPEFVTRFNIPRVAEFYGATEGNANIVNIDNTVGAIGFISRIIPKIYPISIIRCDPATGEPIRDKNGLCMRCKPNEPGVFIGKIVPSNPSRAFLGYVDKEASKKKVVHDVFTKGDSAFLSGDIIMADKFGNLFFMDRTGDTFRWKGENVSTSEVEAVVSNIVDYKDCVVYGVEIVGQEGRAGMAAILDPENTINLEKMVTELQKNLPAYARPIFVRVLKTVDMTGTYKLKKNDLQKEGFDPNVITDPMYYYEASVNKFIELTNEKYDGINSGAIRV
ncbi:long-chain fatty acid transport protein 4-like isoform X1 [Onthophagus taurus]|uniref:long-chain fatty acid transport protein 4-like isoform X1 n=2 Tax=Onthophagus taurus TaxID=166361 RepID=UPI0039BDCD6A